MKNLAIIILIVCCCFLLFAIFAKREAVEGAKIPNDYLDTGLKRMIELKDRTLIHKVRVPEVGQGTKEGQSLLAAKTENFYIPPEGSFSYIEREDGEYKLDVKDYGFIFKLYFGYVKAPFFTSIEPFEVIFLKSVLIEVLALKYPFALISFRLF